MDTDALSRESYEGILIEAEKLELTCKKILENIRKVKSTPIEKRKFHF